MNCRFFLLWILCMIYTLIEKHEIFKSLFNFLAIASCNREFANQIKHDFDIDIDINENISPNIKKEIKSTKFRKSQRKPKGKPKLEKSLFKRKQKKENLKKRDSKSSSNPEELRMSSNRMDITKHNVISFGQSVNLTSKECETKDRIQSFISRKKKNSPKLCIAECILEEESYSKYKNLKEESKEELKEDYSIDLSYDENIKKAKNRKLAMFKFNYD